MALKYAVIGTGAIGGYYGGKLAHSGQDVHFLFHSDYEYVSENGLIINSVSGDFSLPQINAYKDTKDMPVCDVVLVCLKTTSNHILKELLPPLLHKNTVVLMIQNGLGVESDLQKDFPNLNIAGGLAFICSTKKGPGLIYHLDYGKLTIGSYSCSNQSILEQICTDFNNAEIPCDIQDLKAARWKKLVWNIPFNGTTVVLNTTTDKLLENEYTKKLVLEMMEEVIEAANTSDLINNPIPLKYALDIVKSTEKMTPYSPSMKVDFDSQRELEINYLYTQPIEYAAKYGFKMTCASVIEKQLHFIQSLYFKK